MLAGIEVPDDDVQALILALDHGFDEIAEALRIASAFEWPRLSLTIDDRQAILAVLEDPPDALVELPDGLVELRAVLLNEHEWRQREGL